MASFKQTDLLAEPVEPDELKVLLSRLAATEEIFAEPQTTIRDVAEATDASPLLIGRILREMRGPDRVEMLEERINRFEAIFSSELTPFRQVDSEHLQPEVSNTNPYAETWRELKAMYPESASPVHKDVDEQVRSLLWFSVFLFFMICGLIALAWIVSLNARR